MAKSRTQKANELDEATVERIKESVRNPKPYKTYGPACTCGLTFQGAASTGARFGAVDIGCQRHVG